MIGQKRILIIILLFTSFFNCVFSQKTSDIPKELSQEQIEQLIEETNAKVNSILKSEVYLPGMAVAIVSRNKILMIKGYGYIDKSQISKVDSNTIFGIQSVTKPITVTGLMIAEQEGLINLDIPIINYLPEFTIKSRFPDDPMSIITIRHLISMTSGLAHDAPVGNNTDAYSPSYESHIQSISQTWLKFPPEERAEYSNLGIELAAYCLEQVINKPFTEYIQEKVFDPLGMKHSSYDFNTIRTDTNRAIGNKIYYQAMPFEVPMLAPAAVYSSINDMAQFINFHLNVGKKNGSVILQEEGVKQMQTIPFPVKGQLAGYAQGLRVSYYHLGGQDIRCIAHGGGGFGFRCQMKWLPDLGYGVMVMTNSENHNNVNENLTEKILLKIVNLLTGKDNKGSSDWLNRHLPPSSIESNFLPSNLEGNYNGSFYDLQFMIKDSTFGFKSGTRFIPVKPISELEYISRDHLYQFRLNEQGEAISIVRPYDGLIWNISKRKDEAKGPDNQEWEQYEGTYIRKRHGLSDRFYNVVMENGWLHFIGGGMDYRLTEFKPGVFYLTDGDIVDLNSDNPTYRNIKLYKVCDQKQNFSQVKSPAPNNAHSK